ncbi:integrase [Salmonella enterica]|uniref:Integrase n=1 Tax=Salmonella enterica TaxID=28901 RepID=A0A379QJ50_SALER|nr:integrase [Salmonella enterica]
MSLYDAKIRSVKLSDNPFKLTDSQGLYLFVNPGGSRHWYLKLCPCQGAVGKKASQTSMKNLRRRQQDK